MISAFVVSSAGPAAPDLAADLDGAGIKVVGRGEAVSLVQDVIRSAPDLVVCYETHPNDALFASTQALEASAPRPVVIFTTDPGAENIERAARAGVHAYVVNGYAAGRLRPVIHVAQARFRHTQMLRDALSDINNRFAERKLVDRAKGILMRLRNCSEDEAYAFLRSAAMQSKLRIGQLAQKVIDAARYGEAVNRAGQLRMMSQRLVKLYAVLCSGAAPFETRSLFTEAVQQVERNLGLLTRILSKATFGDLLDAVADPWTALKAALLQPPSVERLADIDALAERLLAQAEQLTSNLENAGFAAALRLINVSGRQRMLTQRLAKQAILGRLIPRDAANGAKAIAATRAAFVQAMTYLRAVPLTTPAISEHLDAATQGWAALEAAVPNAGTGAGQRALVDGSEALLATFEALTGEYERNLQMLME